MIPLHEIEQRLRALIKMSNDEDSWIIGVLLQEIPAWETSSTPPAMLSESLARTHRNVRFSRDETTTNIHAMLTQFRKTAESLGGMTMNERLVMFNLIDQWDSASDVERQLLRERLVAPR